MSRLGEDAIDEHADDPLAMQKLQQRLAAIYDGQPEAIVEDRAMAMVAQRYGLPRELPEALLEGFAWDAAGRRYETLEDLHDYCARVAGSVGAMMAMIMGITNPQAIARACELGNAMQLTNIARDVGEDARNGRLYLPRAWMRQAGIDPDAWLVCPQFTPALGDVIGRVIADRQMNSVNDRAVVGYTRKLTLLCIAKARAQLPTRCETQAPLPAIQFLIDACALGTERKINGLSPKSFDERCEWVIDLFERLSTPGRQA